MASRILSPEKMGRSDVSTVGFADIGAVDFPSQGTVIDHAKLDVDASGWVWTLNHLSNRNTLNFRTLLPLPAMIFHSVVLHMAERVTLTSVDNVRNAFEALCFLSRSKVLVEELAAEGTVSTAFFIELRTLGGFATWRLHYIRFWYRWCAKQGLPGFSRETANLLDDMVIGGNEKGRAVRTRDPENGAFDDIEYAAIVTRLRAFGDKVLSVSERVLVSLALAFGRNPLAYALMREDDYRPVKESGTGKIYHRFDIPQIKQRYENLRSGFDPKMLNQEYGTLIATLVAENVEGRERNGWPEGCAFPLFVRHAPNEGLLDGPLHEFAMHISPEEISDMLQGAMDKLDVQSHRTGGPLKSNPRRFRRTLATKMVEDGASPTQVAIGLGHSDTQNVHVYFETRASQVDRLDAAVAVTLGPFADAFMGRIVDNESDAVNGGDPSKRIPGFRIKFGETPKRTGDVGTCGAGACGLLAPISCYTCEKFQPWRTGPHRDVLESLVEKREREQKAGLDPQIYKINDAAILAIGKVVAACEGGDE
jgi:integrase